MIKIRELNKYFNKGSANQIHVINNTTIELPSSGLVTFLGASGSGKTTLLNVIGGLDNYKGDIIYDEEKFVNYKMGKIDAFRRRNIGYVFQNYNLLPHISVYDNLALSLNLIGVTNEEEIEKRIEYCLKAVKMNKFKKRLAHALSGGQQQRISIARALVKNAKIIIADEPTGNLDSANTLEVMNILKKISETRLVLLVTHDRNIAHFYSDRIVELKDGSIISDNANEVAFQNLDTRKTDVIYLQDLEKKDGSYENIKMTIYHEPGEEIKDLEFTLVYKNGQIYLETKQRNLKLVGANTEIKLLDEKYKMLDKSEVSNYDFDLRNFSEVKAEKKIDIKGFLIKLRSAFVNFTSAKLRTKFLYFGLFVIGCIIASAVVSFSEVTYVDESYMRYEGQGYSINDNGDQYDYEKNFEINQKLTSIIDIDDNITDIVLANMQSNYFSVSPKQNGSLYKAYPASVYTLVLDKSLLSPSDIYNNLGSINALDNEVVIDKIVADKLLDSLKAYGKYNYNDLLGQSLDDYYKIIGITNRGSNAVYFNQKNLRYFNGKYYDISIGMPSLFDLNSAEFDEGHFAYEIVYGTKFTSTAENQVLINIKYVKENLVYQAGINLNDTVSLYVSIAGETANFRVVGYFSSEQTNANYIANNSKVRYSVKSEDRYYSSPRNILNAPEFKLLEGKLPTNDNEQIVSVYSGFKVGDKVSTYYGDFTVVGLYWAASGYEEMLVSTKKYLKMQIEENYYGYKSILIFSSDIEQTKKHFADMGLNLEKSYDAMMAMNLQEAMSERRVMVIMSIVLISVVVIYVFFMMRAKMISRIYDIGVYRALGATKNKIYGMFFLELLVQTTFTTLFGYIVTMIVVAMFGKALSGLGELFHFNTLYAILGVLFLYACNLFFGLLPIVLLLRKTPSQIIAKYDI